VAAPRRPSASGPRRAPRPVALSPEGKQGRFTSTRRAAARGHWHAIGTPMGTPIDLTPGGRPLQTNRRAFRVPSHSAPIRVTRMRSCPVMGRFSAWSFAPPRHAGAAVRSHRPTANGGRSGEVNERRTGQRSARHVAARSSLRSWHRTRTRNLGSLTWLEPYCYKIYTRLR
jgi:hypothetical protein